MFKSSLILLVPFALMSALPASASLTFVSGSIESIPYSFEVRDAHDLYSECVGFSALLPIVNDITVSLNGAPAKSLHNPNGHYWTSIDATCVQISQSAVQQGLPLSPDAPRYIVHAMIENHTVLAFSGNSLNELDLACNKLRVAMPFYFNDISVSLNYGAPQLIHNERFYWGSLTEACNESVGVIAD